MAPDSRGRSSLGEECERLRAELASALATEAVLTQALDRFRQVHVCLVAAQEDQRGRLARELHDDVSQRLALLAVNLHLVRQAMPEAPNAWGESVTEMYRQVQALARDVRRLSHDLYPARLEPLGLASAMRGLCDEVSALGVAVEFHANNVTRDLPQPIAICLYRAAEEALRNVVRHSGATTARVGLEQEDAELVLEVSDGGRGFDVASPRCGSGIGLECLRERVAAVNGRFSLESEPGRGTRIEVRVPLAG